ncbi:MAG: hypothetical protein KGI69_03600 [Patescibacteria group bacterium]|nr:hypothetical protein [Patescibacteria group bacterium]
MKNVRSVWSLITIVRLILEDRMRIDELPSDEFIVTTRPDAVPLKYHLSVSLARKLSRLQTLKARVYERCPVPSEREIEHAAIMTCKDAGQVERCHQAVQEDAMRVQAMIEQIMVELVRQAFPQEFERMGAVYLLYPGGKLMWAPSNICVSASR